MLLVHRTSSVCNHYGFVLSRRIRVKARLGRVLSHHDSRSLATTRSIRLQSGLHCSHVLVLSEVPCHQFLPFNDLGRV